MVENYVTIVGGANVDISGTSYCKLIPNDSNPGRTTTSLGGVGRNIGENLARMGVRVKLITALGDDGYSKEIQNNCRKHSINLDHSLIIPGEQTSSYLCINNELGEMEVAISSMEIYEHITPDYLAGKINIINQGKICVVDTNIPQESLEYLFTNSGVPIFLDTVSTLKTEKIQNSLHSIHTLKPNIIETEILSGMKIITEDDLKIATNIIIEKGVKNLFVSLGPEGVYYTDGSTAGRLLPIPTEVVNTTGAGDSYLAAVIWSYLNRFDLEESAKAGLAASSICIKSNLTVAEEMSTQNIKSIIKNNWRD